MLGTNQTNKQTKIKLNENNKTSKLIAKIYLEAVERNGTCFIVCFGEVLVNRQTLKLLREPLEWLGPLKHLVELRHSYSKK